MARVKAREQQAREETARAQQTANLEIKPNPELSKPVSSDPSEKLLRAAELENARLLYQAELADALEQIKIRHRGEYSATPEELQALDEADSSGIASEQDVEAALRTFRRA